MLLRQENEALCCVPIAEKKGLLEKISPLLSIGLSKARFGLAKQEMAQKKKERGN